MKSFQEPVCVHQLTISSIDYGITAHWNFFATSHGKGENDGIGGDVKNAVWRKTLQLKVVLNNLAYFVDVAKAKFPSFVISACLNVSSSEAFLRTLRETFETMPWHEDMASC